MIKQNHILAAGSITQAIATERRLHPEVTLEVEIEDLAELQEALATQPDIIMRDNFDLATMAEAVKLTAGRVKLEASGNVNLDTIWSIAETGGIISPSGASPRMCGRGICRCGLAIFFKGKQVASGHPRHHAH